MDATLIVIDNDKERPAPARSLTGLWFQTILPTLPV
jgi:hypothetical protein